MQFFQFIFLKRNWAVDKGPLTKQMTRFARSNDPLWLLIFPEGTIVSEETRVTSKKFADKTGLVDHKYVLLPRSTGLHFCKSALGKSIDYLYDLTIGLEEIPQDEDKFTIWLRDRWSEKDVMMEEFYKNGRFSSYESPRIVPMRLMNGFFELLQIWYFVIPLIPLLYYYSHTIFESISRGCFGDQEVTRVSSDTIVPSGKISNHKGSLDLAKRVICFVNGPLSTAQLRFKNIN
ncbi:6046_t:CDS:2 [Entrophospora sp. SA101]|nr:6046_t:CDS:2 [Entrophospora sp. SA101]